MANYQESAVSGTQWRRASRIVIDNPQQGNPTILIVEDTATQLGDSVINQPSGNLSATVEQGATFPLVNPATGEVIGESSHDEVYALIYSLYMHLATQRDALIAPVVVVPEPEPEPAVLPNAE